MRKLILMSWLWLGAHGVVFSMAVDFVDIKFPSTTDIFANKDRFITLSAKEVMEILKQDDFQVDSENSVLYATLLWMTGDSTKILERGQHLKELMSTVRFLYLEKPYVMYILPKVSSWFPDDKEFIQDIYELACDACNAKLISEEEKLSDDVHKIIEKNLENREFHYYQVSQALKGMLNNENRDFPELIKAILINIKEIDKYSVIVKLTDKFKQQQLKPHIPLLNSKKLAMKVEFKNISQLSNRRYYSRPMFRHGYQFQYFLKKDKFNDQEHDTPSNLTVGGYLRCVPPTKGDLNEGPCIAEDFVLPLCVTVKIETRNGEERVYTRANYLFNNFRSSIGGRLGLEEPNKESFDKLSDWPIMVDDKITVFLICEFIPSK